MRKKQHDPLEAGTIIKQLAPVLGLTVKELRKLFTDYKPMLGDDLLRHYLMGETPWPFEDMDYTACLDMAYNFLDKQQRKKKLTGQQAKDKKQEVKRILKVAFMDLDSLTIRGKKFPDIRPSNIENEIEWIMRDINNLEIETLYILNRFFYAFSSITECDLKWIDFLDCLGYVKGLVTIDEFKLRLSKEAFPVSCELILNNMNSKDLQQWLELLSRSKGRYSDTMRKKNENKIDKLKSDVKEKIRSYTDDYGFEVVSLHNFIQYLINEHDGSFFDVKYWETFLLIKYWASHFLEVPEITINIFR